MKFKLSNTILSACFALTSLTGGFAHAKAISFYCTMPTAHVPFGVSAQLSLAIDLDKMILNGQYQELNMVDSTDKGAYLVGPAHVLTMGSKSAATFADAAGLSLTMAIENSEVAAVIDGRQIETHFDFIKSNLSRVLVGDVASCKVLTTNFSVGDPYAPLKETLDFVRNLKLKNISPGGTEVIRKELRVGNLDLLCYEELAHRSYGVNWPHGGECQLSVPQITLSETTTGWKLQREESSALSAALPQKVVSLKADFDPGYGAAPHSVKLDCTDPKACLIGAVDIGPKKK